MKDKNTRLEINGIKGAIFDLDGTLLDSIGMWADIDIKFLNRRGIDVPNDYMHNTSAMSAQEAANYTIKLFNLKETSEELMSEWYELTKIEYHNNIKLRDKAKEYLLDLKKNGIKLAVATSLKKELIRPCLENNGVYHLFDVICSVSDVERGKEFPDIYEFVMEKLSLKSNECVIFEDILTAIKSAKKTDAVVIAVAEKYSFSHKEEILKIADYYINDYEYPPILS